MPFLVRLLPADAWRHTQKCKRLDLSTTRALDLARIGLGLYVARDDKCEPLAFAGANGACQWFTHAPLVRDNIALVSDYLGVFLWGLGRGAFLFGF